MFNQVKSIRTHNKMAIKYLYRMINNFAKSSERSTIFSLSSGHGKCGVAVIRVSGPHSLTAIKRIAKFTDIIPKPRYAYLRKFWHPKTNELIDKGLLLWFPGPYSFTGEDCGEFQVHGGPAVIAALLDALAAMNTENECSEIRLAKPGEFTKRAFEAGKLDLTEVEGLADLIHAETEQQRKQALLQADGSLSKLYQNWRNRLLKCIAHIEAFIDFAEDQHIDDTVLDEINDKLALLESDITKHLNDGRRGEILRNGVKCAIIGAPNVGKSSFMNKICCKPISIVTSIEGTTRDIVEHPFNIAGYPVVFADTAGLRSKTTDIVETEGISRAINCAQMADFILLIMDAQMLEQYHFDLPKCRKQYFLQLNLDEEKLRKPMLTVINKVDLMKYSRWESLVEKCKSHVAFVSCKYDIGIEDAVIKMANQLETMCGHPSAESPNLSQQRHRHLAVKCLNHLQTFRRNYLNDEVKHDQDFAIAAHHLRSSLRCIGQITGNVSTEEILDVIFRDFCIGK